VAPSGRVRQSARAMSSWAAQWLTWVELISKPQSFRGRRDFAVETPWTYIRPKPVEAARYGRLVEGRGIEGDAVADLWMLKVMGHAVRRFWFERCAAQRLRCVRRLSLEDVGAFEAHGFIDEQADAFGEAFEPSRVRVARRCSRVQTAFGGSL